MYPHRIRLRGPWEFEPAPGDGPPPRRVTMPGRWAELGLGEFAGRARLRRRFGRPSRVDDEERVWLTFGGVTDSAEAWLNGRPLGRFGEDAPFEADVTALLATRNELVVEVESAAPGGGLWGEVALEVRRTAFLRDVAARLVPGEGGAPCLQVSGKAVGFSPRPLELYALVGGRTVLYGTIAASSEGTPFVLTSEPPEAGTASETAARVELIDAAVVWYAVEVPLTTTAEQVP